MSKTWDVSLMLNPIFSQSGLADPSGFCAFFGGSLKWGVIFVRYPYCSGEGIVVPIAGRLGSGSPGMKILVIRCTREQKHFACRTREVPVSLHDYVPLEIQLGIIRQLLPKIQRRQYGRDVKEGTGDLPGTGIHHTRQSIGILPSSYHVVQGWAF